MAFKDKAAKYAYDAAWHKENTTHVGFRLSNSSGIPDALKLAEQNSGKTKSGYIIAALREALIRDGYLQENQDS